MAPILVIIIIIHTTHRAHSLKPHGYEYQYLAEDVRNINSLKAISSHLIILTVMTAGRD